MTMALIAVFELNTSFSTGITISVAMLALFIGLGVALWRFAKRGGLTRLSHLKCPNCGFEFDYAWIPGFSLTAVRLLNSRFMACPNCHKWSTFEIAGTQVDPETHHCPTRIGPL